MADLTNLPTGPVSGRTLARLLGLSSDNAVRSAVRSGRLRRCVLPGGGFDARLAVEEWRAATDPRQQRKVTEATDAAAASEARRAKGKAAPAKGRAPRAAPPPAPAPPPGPRGTDDLQARLAAHRAERLAAAAPRPGPSDGDGEAGADGRTMADIRRDLLLVEEQVQLFDWGLKLGAALPRDPILAAVQTLGREFRDATQRIPDQYGAQIAAELGVDRHACHEVLDRYCRMHFESVIAGIDVTKILGEADGDGDATA